MREPTILEVAMDALGISSLDELKEDLDIKQDKLKPARYTFGEFDQYTFDLTKVNKLTRICIDEEWDPYEAADYAYFVEDNIRRDLDIAFTLDSTEATMYIQSDFYNVNKDWIDRMLKKLGKVERSSGKYLEFYIEFAEYLTADDIVESIEDLTEELE